MLIKEGINNHEIKITKKLKRQNNSKDTWKDINKQRWREEDKKDTVIYDDEGKPIEKDKAGEVICNYWRGIYQPDENKICITWNDEEKENYKRIRRGNQDKDWICLTCTRGGKRSV